MNSQFIVPLCTSLAIATACGKESKRAETQTSTQDLFKQQNAQTVAENRNNNAVPPPNESWSLGEQLTARAEQFGAKAPKDVRTKYAAGLQSVIDAQTVDKAIQVGQIAPPFQLQNASGEKIILSNLLQAGPVILMWYRGGWCPYCNLALRAMQKRLPEFQAKGAQLVAISPELPDKTLSTGEKHALKFNVLSDPQNEVAEKYRVVFDLTADVARIYEEKFGLHEWNGDSSNKLPLAATYLIAQDGTVRWAFLNADYRKRAEPADILRALGSL